MGGNDIHLALHAPPTLFLLVSQLSFTFSYIMRWDPHSKSPLISILSSISSFSLCPTRIVQLHLTTNDEIGGMIDFFVMCHEGQAFYLCGVTEKMEDGLTLF